MRGFEEAVARVGRLPRDNLNEYGFDPFGFSPDFVARIAPLAHVVYRRYFRAAAYGIEKVPTGRVILVANHSGQIPIDGMIIACAMMLDAEPPRMVRSMVEKFVPALPFVSYFMSRTGQVVGTPDNCVRLLERDETILAFPEGVAGISKTFSKRYQLQEFGHGFMRLALQTRSPIVPVAVIGGEEQAPSLYNSRAIARLFAAPSFPITPTLLPLPVKYRLYFGEPMRFKGDAEAEDRQIEPKVRSVRSTLQALVHRGLRERRHVFW
ncbi:MAG: acyltransferase family protein [Deltaproteobacteria bacterium]|nr:acyltransferase family protein [Deltaproteobacteria bacterium]